MIKIHSNYRKKGFIRVGKDGKGLNYLVCEKKKRFRKELKILVIYNLKVSG